jgi:hypothetical protein
MILNPEAIMSMLELSKADRTVIEQSTGDVENRIDEARNRAASFIFGTQKLMLEELVFAGNEMFERAQTETHLLSEFVSKMAGAHSVKDIRTMYEECAKHQIEFARRDCDRLLKNGEHMIEGASKLFKSHPLN